MHRDHDLNGFAAGLLLGGLVGAGTILLFAPQAGKKTRRRVQQRGRALRGQTTAGMADRIAAVRATAQKATSGSQGEAEAADEAERLFREEALMVWGDEGGAVS